MSVLRIICVGNRYVQADAAGPAVYARLRAAALPPGVELVDGGLGGLDLLRLAEGAERVVFVDQVSGFAAPGEVVELPGAEAAATAGPHYDHAAGLAYLLRVLPAVCAGPPPEVWVVGIEGSADAAAVEAAAAASLRLALEGQPLQG